MSVELRKGIPKAVPTGEQVIFTEEEKEEYDRQFEEILREFGVITGDMSIKDFKDIEGPEDFDFKDVKFGSYEELEGGEGKG